MNLLTQIGRIKRSSKPKQTELHGWLSEESLIELDKLWASASQRTAGLIHGISVARSREEFLEAMIESWPAIRENLNRHK